MWPKIIEPIGTVRSDSLLSRFEIVPNERFERGRPYQQTRLNRYDGELTAIPHRSLKAYRNWNGHWYAESHVEEWIARHPEAIFPNQKLIVRASQNYIHLPKKIDLLLEDSERRLFIIEIKAASGGRRNGIAPDQIRSQMRRYVTFLNTLILPGGLPLATYSVKFSKIVMTDSTEDYLHSVEWPLNSAPVGPPISQIFLTEGYDAYAVNSLLDSNATRDFPVRLLYFRFYCDSEERRHFVEFWESRLAR
jgi:hypothetical protein